jgi:hypothetical protein
MGYVVAWQFEGAGEPFHDVLCRDDHLVSHQSHLPVQGKVAT